MTALALALLATPFLFGMARLVNTASDWRYLVVAIASTLGATIVVRRWNGAAGIVRRLVAPFAVAVLLSAIAALAVGARSPTSVAVVAISFAFCSATGAVLLARAREDGQRGPV